MEVADYRRMSSFELIDRINETISWADEENEPCMRELCDRYHIDFDLYDEYEPIWDRIIREVYDDAEIQAKYVINDRDYTIVSLSDDDSIFAVVDEVRTNWMFTVYEIGTMQECKNYVKERIDID